MTAVSLGCLGQRVVGEQLGIVLRVIEGVILREYQQQKGRRKKKAKESRM
jgi:hypothetical protein